MSDGAPAKPNEDRSAQRMPDQDTTDEQKKQENYPLSHRPSSEEPDVLIDVPVVKVDEIELEVADLRARLSLHADVLDLLKLHVGADVTLGRVGLRIKGVEAQALLKVRLDNVAAMIDRVLTTIDRNPEILEHVTREVGTAIGQVGRHAGEAVGELGRGTGDAVESVGRGTGDAVDSVGRGTGDAVESVGRGTGDAAGEAGRAAAEEIGAPARSGVENAEATAHARSRSSREAPLGPSQATSRERPRARRTDQAEEPTPRRPRKDQPQRSERVRAKQRPHPEDRRQERPEEGR